jgi:hypothetical protein
MAEFLSSKFVENVLNFQREVFSWKVQQTKHPHPPPRYEVESRFAAHHRYPYLKRQFHDIAD